MPTSPTNHLRSVSPALKREVLTEAGYRCAVPTCRTILALDLHHIIAVQDGGPNTLSNLLALCPTCHALYTRGMLPREAIDAWKQTLVVLSHAFDAETISLLLLFTHSWSKELLVSGDGLLRFAPLLIADLAVPSLIGRQGLWQVYHIDLTVKGQCLLDAWCAGNREQVRLALTNLPGGSELS